MIPEKKHTATIVEYQPTWLEGLNILRSITASAPSMLSAEKKTPARVAILSGTME